MSKGIFLVVAVLLFGGCVSTMPNSLNISNTLNSYQKFSNDKEIKKYAPREYQEAKRVYGLLQSEKDEKRADHLAYLLKSEMSVASSTAKEVKLRSYLSKLKEEKLRKRLKERERELQKIKQEKEDLILRNEELENLDAKMTDRGLVFVLGDQYFEKDKTRLLISSIRSVDKLVDFLNKNPHKKVLIEGYSDDSKSSPYNIDFSLRRAKSVKDMLTAQGISSDRVTIKGMGEANPIAPNDTIEGRSKNTRVVITILKESKRGF